MADEVELGELDLLLRQELSVEPSPAFLPRVRARVEREGTPGSTLHGLAVSTWWRRPRWQLTVAMATLVAVAGTILLQRAPVMPAPAVAGVATNQAPVSLAPVTPLPEAPTASELTMPTQRLATARARRAVVPRRLPRVPAVEVIVDPGQRQAIAQVLALVNSGRLTEASFVVSRASERPAIDEVTTTPIVVEPLAVSPFAGGGVLQKEPERH